ncbi:MAG: class I adenylate-forming enzyme family protein [Acidimicrobiia bacterium]
MDWLTRWAVDRPDRPFLTRDREVVDFATARERIAGLVGGLRARYGSGTHLGVVMAPEPDSVLTALAVQFAGMVLVPLPVSGRAMSAELAERAQVTDVITAVDEVPAPMPELDSSADTAAVFSSGSSGVPRAVRLTWDNIEASARASAVHLQHRPDDRWLAVLPLHHVGGLSIVWRSLREGSTVVLAGPFDVTRTAWLLTTGRASLGSFVGAMLEALADAGLDRAPGFRHGLVGGGPASERALSVGGMSLLPTYGMTETASQVATADPADPDPGRLVPLTDVEISIRGDGRIVVGGPMVSPGEVGGPERDGPFVTADTGRLHEGRLEVLGRADDVIVTGGENVMPAAVEAVLGRIPGAGTVAVVGLADERWGQIVGCVYTGPATEDELAAAARDLLPGFAVPRRWRRADQIPMLGIGKLDRAALRDLFD